MSMMVRCSKWNIKLKQRDRNASESINCSRACVFVWAYAFGIDGQHRRLDSLARLLCNIYAAFDINIGLLVGFVLLQQTVSVSMARDVIVIGISNMYNENICIEQDDAGFVESSRERHVEWYVLMQITYSQTNTNISNATYKTRLPRSLEQRAGIAINSPKNWQPINWCVSVRCFWLCVVERLHCNTL